jgi:hypothetical protein
MHPGPREGKSASSGRFLCFRSFGISYLGLKKSNSVALLAFGSQLRAMILGRSGIRQTLLNWEGFDTS